MRRRNLHLPRALVLIALVAGCRSKPAAPPPPKPAAPADLAAPATVSCRQATACARACPDAELDKCVAGCAAHLSKIGAPYWTLLQSCSKAHCKDACATASAISCKLCVMGNCADYAGGCLRH
jgi:hypothetical protein